jgi:hypothetical protein
MNPVDRRECERFTVSPMYTPVRVRLEGETEFARDGHAYDISESGLRFELDHPVEAGTPMTVELELPRAGLWASTDDGPGRTIELKANVVWCDTEEPGPARMAASVTEFIREGDKPRLMRLLTSGQFLRAA